MRFRDSVEPERLKTIGKLGLILLIIDLVGPITNIEAARGQALGEFAGVNAGVAGMGAGVAASMGNGALVRNTYESAVQAQQALAAQNKAVEQYFKMGSQLEIQKQWASAEKAFTYVLQVIARRDGPGSTKALPTLKHLTAVSQAQGKLEDAISYQKTVLAFTKAGKTPDKTAVVQESVNLSNLFIKRSEYGRAEAVLHDSLAIAKQPGIPRDALQRTLAVYGKVLRQLDRTNEAQNIENELSQISTVATTPAPVQPSPPTATPTATPTSYAAAPINSSAPVVNSTAAGQPLIPNMANQTPLSRPDSNSAPVSPAEPQETWHRANNEPEPTPVMIPMTGAPPQASTSQIDLSTSTSTSTSTSASDATAASASPPTATPASMPESAPAEAAASASSSPASPPPAVSNQETPQSASQDQSQEQTKVQDPSRKQESSQGKPSSPGDFSEPQPLPMPITLPDGTTLPPQKQ